jgi:soluble lytic murein transglycosylase-like protein
MKIDAQMLRLDASNAAPSAVMQAGLEFERMLVEQMLESMEQSLDQGFFESGGSSSAYYGGLFREAMSQEVIGQDGLGLAKSLEQRLQAPSQAPPLFTSYYRLQDRDHTSTALGTQRAKPMTAVDPSRWSSPSDESKAAIQALVRVEAKRAGLDEKLAMMLVSAESGFDSKARSKVGAMGLTQLMPATADALGVRDPWNPQENLAGGFRYLRSLIDRFDGDRRLALAAYNAGPNAVEQYGGVPPYSETMNYIARIEQGLGEKL